MTNKGDIFFREIRTNKSFNRSIQYSTLMYGLRINSEDDLQKACVQWFEDTHPGKCGRFKLHHSPNGGKRNAIEALKFKKMGVRAGFPDLWIALGDGRCGFIELKYGKNGLSDHQKDYRDFLTSQGFPYAVCYTVDEFARTITKWEKGVKK